MRFCLILAVVLSMGAMPVGARDISLPDGPYISTSADGEVVMPPDFAVFDLHFRAVEPTAEAARDRVSAVQSRVLEALQDFDGALREQRLERMEFGEEWVYDRTVERRVRAGYFGSFAYRVELTDFERMNALHFRLAGLELESVQGPRFEITDEHRAALERRARARAVEEARIRAEQLASAQGATLGPIWAILFEPMHEIAGRQSSMNRDGPVLGALRAENRFAMDFEPQPVRFSSRAGVVYTLLLEPPGSDP